MEKIQAKQPFQQKQAGNHDFQIKNPCQSVIGRHKQQGKDKGDAVHISKGNIQIGNTKTGEKHQ